MTETINAVQAKLAELFAGGWVMTAVAIGLERGLLGRLSPTEARAARELAGPAGMSADLAASVLDVLASTGLVVAEDGCYRATSGLAALFGGTGGRMLAADLRSTLGMQAGVLARAREAGAAIEGWHSDDPVVVDAQGTASHLLTLMIARDLLPRIAPELAPALGVDGARLLDVGAGSAGGCIGFAATFPRAHVVGIEPAAVPYEQALRRIAEAGLEDRVTMRRGGIEAIDDAGAFDAAYVAQMFIPTAPLAEGLSRVLRALKPGGVLLTVATAAEGGDLTSATSRLRSTVWGGGPRTAEGVRALLERAGFDAIRTAALPGNAVMTPIVARRPGG
jgi:SAM-dependent methyltransferase